MPERYGASAELAERIRDLIRAEPDREKLPDREIGRRLNCHHSWPNRVRAEMAEEAEELELEAPVVPLTLSADGSLESRLAELRQVADHLRRELAAKSHDATDLWAVASQLQGELYSLRQGRSNGDSE